MRLFRATSLFGVALLLLGGCRTPWMEHHGLTQGGEAVEPFGGKIARSYEDSEEWWAERV